MCWVSAPGFRKWKQWKKLAITQINIGAHSLVRRRRLMHFPIHPEWAEGWKGTDGCWFMCYVRYWEMCYDMLCGCFPVKQLDCKPTLSENTYERRTFPHDVPLLDVGGKSWGDVQLSQVFFDISCIVLFWWWVRTVLHLLPTVTFLCRLVRGNKAGDITWRDLEEAVGQCHHHQEGTILTNYHEICRFLHSVLLIMYSIAQHTMNDSMPSMYDRWIGWKIDWTAPTGINKRIPIPKCTERVIIRLKCIFIH